jgi:hypothetical protein
MLHADAAFKQQATTNHSLNATPTPSHILPHCIEQRFFLPQEQS